VYVSVHFYTKIVELLCFALYHYVVWEETCNISEELIP